MKNKIFFLVLSVFNMYGIFAQVITKINDVTLNGQTVINNCGLIDLGTNSNNTLYFYFKLSKPSNQVLGNSNLKILLKYDSSSYGSEKGNLIVLSNSWANNTDFVSNIQCNVSESEIKTTGSSIVLEFITDSGVKSRSCEYPLMKTLPPSFTFSPTSLSLPCGDTSSRTFTVTPANIPSGANVTYQWSYSGSWSGTVNSSMNSVTLTPNSVISLPSTVSVIPYIDGLAYPSKSCTISRSSIASSGSISGSATVCTTRTFTFEGLLAGESVTWNLSNTTAGTLSSTTGTSTTFTATGGGAVDLIATATNGCGQSYVRTLGLFAGSPPAFAMSHDLYENQYCDTKYHQVPFIFKIPAGSSLSILYKYPNASYTVTSLGNNEYRYTFAFSKSYSGYFNLIADITNSCGSSYFETEGEYYIQSCTQIGANSNQLQDNLENKFTVFPNPANDVVTIELKDSENQPQKESTISGELFDMLGQSKSKIKISDNKATFSVKGLKKGIYVLKILINDQVESHRIAVE